GRARRRGACGEQEQEFTGKPVWQRIAIVLAGPAFNLLFAVAAFWAMLVIGKPDYQPLIGHVSGLAAQAQLQHGDRVLSINGSPVANWTDLGLALADAAQARKPLPLSVREPDGTVRTHVLHFEQLPPHLSEGALLDRIGMTPAQRSLPPVVGEIEKGSAAVAAGLKPGDRIVAIDGAPVHWWGDISDAVKKHAADGRAMTLHIQRGGKFFDVAVRPKMTLFPDGHRGYAIGIGAKLVEAKYDTVLRRGPLEAIPAALEQTWDLTSRTVQMLGQMIAGSASLKNISGPISIAQYANQSADMGPAWFLYFLGIVSLSLGIMNLLPIPILDGGHLLYYLIELVKGSPLSERAMMAGQYVGMALLVAMMGLAFYNDILRLVS
ncbi:MAG: RIP metalloprotease RseP, partial [Rhodanobacteraceae bacterium]